LEVGLDDMSLREVKVLRRGYVEMGRRAGSGGHEPRGEGALRGTWAKPDRGNRIGRVNRAEAEAGGSPVKEVHHSRVMRATRGQTM